MNEMSSLPSACGQCSRLRTAFYRSDDPTAVAGLNALRLGRRVFPARRALYREGETAREILVLLDGWAFRYKMLGDNRRQILSFLLPGDPVCLPLLVADRLGYAVQSLTHVTACVFNRTAFADHICAHPDLNRQADIFCHEMAAAGDERLADLGRRSAYERVARLILELVRRMEGKGIGTRNPVSFPLGQTHIADALGLTPIHTGRILRRLKRDGVLSLSRGRLDILNRAALQVI